MDNLIIEELRLMQTNLTKDIEYIKKSIDELKSCLRNDYVPRLEFEPVKKIVYGMTGLMLVSVTGAVVALVLK